MTNLIALAKQAGLDTSRLKQYPAELTELQAFADLIRQEEREACAQICDSVNNFDNPMTAIDCAELIRARTTT